MHRTVHTYITVDLGLIQLRYSVPHMRLIAMELKESQTLAEKGATYKYVCKKEPEE